MVSDGEVVELTEVIRALQNEMGGLRAAVSDMRDVRRLAEAIGGLTTQLGKIETETQALTSEVRRLRKAKETS